MKQIICTLSILLFSFYLKAQVTPINNRIVMDISTFPQNGSYNYDSCLKVGADLGMTQVGIFQNWTSLETSPNTYSMTLMDIANYYYPLHNMKIDLTITPIHTNKLEVPSDLTVTPMSSTVMISRFNKMLDTVKAHIPNVQLSSLVIGSEHDVYIGSNATLWADYTTFYNAVCAHAKILWPGLKVATELTFNGITTYSTQAQTLNTNSDYIGVSHYPLNGDFTVKSPTTIINDFATLVALYPTKKLCFYQFGYPSSATCNSSTTLQTQFITQTFQAWDTYAANIYMIDFTWLHDLDAAQVTYWGNYYNLTNPAFLEFLRTLGFRDFNGNGADKPALKELRCQAKVRGFNSLPLSCTCTGLNSETKESTINIFPNPASSFIHINSETLITNIELVNVLGDVVLKEFNLDGIETIDVSKVKAGIYFLKIDQAIIKKIMLQ
ncbi:MAG: T9SS type A sorting domain-containing protein [Sphingobacteriaceae bacterium]|nr:T9SS type A sorting domain-containing protein [Sphingobacteriaceae bacterium]